MKNLHPNFQYSAVCGEDLKDIKSKMIQQKAEKYSGTKGHGQAVSDTFFHTVHFFSAKVLSHKSGD